MLVKRNLLPKIIKIEHNWTKLMKKNNMVQFFSDSHGTGYS